MIAKWAGKCSLCKGPVQAGDDVHYDAEAKTVQHWECFENPKPGPEAYALAADLGFAPSAELERVSWVAVNEEQSRRRASINPGAGTQSLLALSGDG